MGNKYCKKQHPTIVLGTTTSYIWRGMVVVREELEPFMWWQIREGSSNFWFDNWTKLGALYYKASKGGRGRGEGVHA